MATRHEECVLEVGRVYGNMSRSAVVRKYLLETGGKRSNQTAPILQ